MAIAVIEEIVRRLGGRPVLGTDVRSQAELATAVRSRLPLSALKGLERAGLSEREIEEFVNSAADTPAPRRQEAATHG